MSGYRNPYTDPSEEDDDDTVPLRREAEDDLECGEFGRPTAHENCGGCGTDLCPMCFELGGGFCLSCNQGPHR